MIFRYKKDFKQLKTFYRFLQSKPCPKIPINLKDDAPCFTNVVNFSDKIALCDSVGSYTYGNIFLSAKKLSEEITQKMMGKTSERVLFLCSNNVNYIITLWAIWMSGQIAVPLSPLHPQNLLLYYASDAKPKMLITSPKYKEMSHRVAKNTDTQMLVLSDKMKLNCAQNFPEKDSDFEGGLSDLFYKNSDALILYTSGTTGHPKGVILSHKNLCSQVNMLVEAWKLSSADLLLHTLPLNHVHGIVNAMLCPLTVGAKMIMLPKFDANSVWSHLLGINPKFSDRKINVLMAVPTMYTKLIEEYDRVFSKDPKMKEHIFNILKSRVRLMVSGSAPLPNSIFERWLEITGHELLERYGMTEIGMCLSNPYESKRQPGYVGKPLPGVCVKIEGKDINDKSEILVESCNIDGKITVDVKNRSEEKGNPSGLLLVKSNGVFKGYFERPEATMKEFTDDGFFITGDICEYDIEKDLFKILGRANVDIIKSGGYKISALEIETELLNNGDIKECSVVGIPDEKWGERIAAIVVLNGDKTMTVEDLKTWASNRLPKYSIPTVLKVVEAIPRNTMGKVNKREMIKTVFNKLD
ncbi:malonate--CoA ligase ACSF3, mitochondrial [Coccinella septempunctata]|uniref:malonate--CoA ligase ACSF3, mitochondrial n=1 Tax=Coccinella septempunctata TaxID=41139 RepID=UPI001D085E5B|nr:malonate--CoA ligase ACSF3, mitochondrial [Coccinella septempunctata]XP_044746079.1 malonate--CoA ligase ACSF3, mitochondrial [Coccinella septempunctata]